MKHRTDLAAQPRANPLRQIRLTSWQEVAFRGIQTKRWPPAAVSELNGTIRCVHRKLSQWRPGARTCAARSTCLIARNPLSRHRTSANASVPAAAEAPHRFAGNFARCCRMGSPGASRFGRRNGALSLVAKAEAAAPGFRWSGGGRVCRRRASDHPGRLGHRPAPQAPRHAIRPDLALTGAGRFH